MVVTGSIRFGDKQYNNKDIDPFEYSYHHQKPITIDVTNAIKYLGQRLDPIQDAAMGLIGNTIIAFPPKFPSAFSLFNKSWKPNILRICSLTFTRN